MNETEVIVYQVRAVDGFGNSRIVHAYESEQAAKDAIAMMRSRRSGLRYIYVPVPNNPNEFWGINFPK
jgi:hypothetical protein